MPGFDGTRVVDDPRFWMVRKLLVPAGEKVVGALNSDHTIPVESVEQVLL
jgi:hypothetical protein